jgi:3-oxoacyl-[acyl-carrier-protein] synthase III
LPDLLAWGEARRPFGVDALAYHLPERRLSVEDWCAKAGRPASTATSIRGHGGAYVHISEEPVETLVYRAVAELHDRGELRRDEIGLIISTHTIQFSVPFPPRNLAAMVASKFDLAPAMTFSVSEQNCVSIYTAIRIARAMLNSDPSLGSALVLAGDVIPSERFRESDGVGLNSDGASALILSPRGARCRIRDLTIGTDTNFSSGIFTDRDPKRGVRSTQSLLLAAERMIGRMLEANGVTRDQLSVVLPHNMDISMWRGLMKFLRLPEGKLFNSNFQPKGHALCNDLTINLADALSSHDWRPYEGPVLCFSRGYGWAYGGMLVDFHTSRAEQ